MHTWARARPQPDARLLGAPRATTCSVVLRQGDKHYQASPELHPARRGPFERVELVLADPARVGRIGAEEVNRDRVDDERLRFHAPHSEQNVRL